MLELYWICLVVGALFALVTLVFGQALDLDGLLELVRPASGAVKRDGHGPN